MFHSRLTGALLLCIMVAACAAAATTKPGLPQTDSATAAAIDKSLAGAQRSATNRARDVYRHPKETLTFFGLRQDMTVVEIWPGAGGWYTEVLAPVLSEKGTLYAAQLDPNTDNQNALKTLKDYRAKLDADAATYGKVKVTALGPNATDIAPAGSADMIVTFRNIHNWMSRGWADKAFAAAFKALKPGGVFGVEEHRGNPAVTQDPEAKSGYVNEDVVIRMAEAAGFKLVAKSEINANPKDTKDYPDGVWTLPPRFILGDKDRDKYAAIGESDRMTLKFVKPAT